MRISRSCILPLHSSASASCHSLADQSSAPWLLDTWQTPRASACWAGVCVAGLVCSDFPNTVGWAGLQLQQLLLGSDSTGGICWLLLSTCLLPVTFKRYQSNWQSNIMIYVSVYFLKWLGIPFSLWSHMYVYFMGNPITTVRVGWTAQFLTASSFATKSMALVALKFLECTVLCYHST